MENLRVIAIQPFFVPSCEHGFYSFHIQLYDGETSYDICVGAEELMEFRLVRAEFLREYGILIPMRLRWLDEVETALLEPEPRNDEEFICEECRKFRDAAENN